MGPSFLRHLIAQRREHYHSKAENRKTLVLGAIYFAVTCIMDVIITSI